jgi:subtilisin family serine protease
VTRTSRFAGALLLTAALICGPGGAGSAGSAGGQLGDVVPSLMASDSVGQVTLVTGDRVTVRTLEGELVPQVEPGAGREDVPFSVYRAEGQLQVVPADAIPLLNAGRLDRRLFDVATLLSFGYDDSRRSDLPLIVQGEARGEDLPDAGIVAAGAEVRALPAAGAVGLSQPKDRMAGLWTEITSRAGARGLADGIGQVWLDGLRQPSLDVSVPQIGAPHGWAAGYTGAGVTVAVLDTGVDLTHPDLAGKVTASRNFTQEADSDDLVGHGTHVASIIAGAAAASGGRYRGVAPDVTLLNGKVCETFGCPESAILAGMQWAAEAGAQVVNLSLGGIDTPDVDPLEEAIDSLSNVHGTLFVVAAGNSGPDSESVSSPASADSALAVGAVDDQDQLAEFSSRGPRTGDAAIKPEVTAPGVAIVAARARNAVIGDPVEDHYLSLSGTSMATPHAAGAAALLAQQHPDWTGSQLKALLIGAADTAEGAGAFAQGAGRIDVGRAVAQDVHTEPAVVSGGRQAWPHDDDTPTTHAITYRNPGDQPRTFALTLQAMGPDGVPAPDGMFELGADRLTVPARGEAAVDVTVDTTVPSPDGAYSAWVVATADETGEIVVTTPVAVDKEVESYDLTMVHRDRNGDLTSEYAALVVGLDEFLLESPYDADGALTVRLPKGRYHLDSSILTPREGAVPELALLVQPLVDLNADTTIELDARLSHPIRVGFRRDDLLMRAAAVSYLRSSDPGVLFRLLLPASLDDLTTAHLGPPVAETEMITQFDGIWAVPDASGGSLRSERVYNLAWYEYGGMMTGLSRDVRDARLARIRADYRISGPGGWGRAWVASHPPGMPPFSATGLPVKLPVRRVELYNTDGVDWSGHFEQLVPADPNDAAEPMGADIALDSRVFDLRPGRTHREQWNGAVFGPLVSDGPSAVLCSDHIGLRSERTGDVITASIPLFSDAVGHAGCADVATARTTLLRDGEPIGETALPGVGAFEVPAERATYRLEADVTRQGHATLSTRVSSAWTFSSERPAGDEPEALPLMAVRFHPDLDRHNRAPAGARYRIPFTIDLHGNAGTSRDRPTVEVSFDDGETWSPLVVRARHDGTYTATLRHPDSGGFVSLRATVTDGDGNRVEQTILRAYQVSD